MKKFILIIAAAAFLVACPSKPAQPVEQPVEEDIVVIDETPEIVPDQMATPTKPAVKPTPTKPSEPDPVVEEPKIEEPIKEEPKTDEPKKPENKVKGGR